VAETSEPAATRPSLGSPPRKSAPRRLPILQILMLLNTFVVVLIAAAFLTSLGRHPARLPDPADDLTSPPQATSQPAQQPETPESPPLGADLAEALSWHLAERAYRDGQYEESLLRFSRLYEHAQAISADARVRDFFWLRTGDCLTRLGQIEAARAVFRELSHSPSAVVRAMASYQLARLDGLTGQYLLARMWAFRALAALESMEKRLPVETDCDFLVGRLLTEKLLSLCGIDAAIPWKSRSVPDPFRDLDEPALRQLLKEGTRNDAPAALSPQVWPARKVAVGARYEVACSQAPLEELLHRLATQAHVDVKWLGVTNEGRRRSVTLHSQEISVQRLAEIACGMVGLLARFTGKEILVYDPRRAASLDEQRGLIQEEALSCWRRFFLRAPEDRRVAQGHFAAGVVHECCGRTLEALREYRLVARQYRRSSVASAGLLRGAKLRIGMRDYKGARSALLELLDRYPDQESSGQVYLCLGEATLKAGLLDESIRVFRKLYYLNLSAASRMKACLGAGTCFYRKGRYDDAREWLKRYIALAEGTADGDMAEACLLLGRSAAELELLDDAVAAFQRVLEADPSGVQRFEAALGVAGVQAKRERFVDAIAALRRIDTEVLSPEQMQRYLLLTASVYRSLGLPDKAISELRKGISLVFEPHLRAVLGLEMARAYAERGPLQQALSAFAAVLPGMEPSPLVHQAECELAEICLKLGKADQAITVVGELLKSSCSQAIRERASRILGAAYVQRREYGQAALAYSGLLLERPESESE